MRFAHGVRLEAARIWHGYRFQIMEIDAVLLPLEDGNFSAGDMV
jgi:hypothetical protein